MKTRFVAALVTLLATAGLALQLGRSSASAATPPSYPVSYNFLTNAIATGTATSAPGSNIWTCRPTAAHPRPVVLVHGTGGNAATNWRTYAALLANKGYCVFALTYGVPVWEALSPVKAGGLSDMVASARQLSAFVTRVRRATGAAKVDIVGHSQGTLMPNYYVRFLGGAQYVDRYISLAPVWHGEGSLHDKTSLNSLLAPLGLTTETLLDSTCTACGQLIQGSPFMTKMRTGRIAASGITYTNIVTRYDDVVLPYTSGIQTGYPNMRNIVLQDICANDFSDHLAIASSANAAQLVLNALDPAHPHQVTCRLTLPVNG